MELPASEQIEKIPDWMRILLVVFGLSVGILIYIEASSRLLVEILTRWLD